VTRNTVQAICISSEERSYAVRYSDVAPTI
jgi:hypothetical protein